VLDVSYAVLIEHRVAQVDPGQLIETRLHAVHEAWKRAEMADFCDDGESNHIDALEDARERAETTMPTTIAVTRSAVIGTVAANDMKGTSLRTMRRLLPQVGAEVTFKEVLAARTSLNEDVISTFNVQDVQDKSGATVGSMCSVHDMLRWAIERNFANVVDSLSKHKNSLHVAYYLDGRVFGDVCFLLLLCPPIQTCTPLSHSQISLSLSLSLLHPFSVIFVHLFLVHLCISF